MNKRFILLSVMFLLMVEIYTQNKFYIWQKDGESSAYTGNDSCVIAIASDEQDAYYKLSSVQKIVVNQPSSTDQTGSDRILFGLPSSVTGNQSEISAYKLIFAYPNPVENELHVKGVISGSILLYGIDGMLIKKQEADKEETTINVTNLNTGVYLLKINNKTIKFNKK